MPRKKNEAYGLPVQDHQVTIRVLPSLHAAIRERATRERLTASDWVRQLVRREIETTDGHGDARASA